MNQPKLKVGDKSILRAVMSFAVDGGISVDGKLAGRIGDSIVITHMAAYAKKVGSFIKGRRIQVLE